MGIKFVSLRDETGRQSSVGIYDGEGSSSEGVQIIGNLPHCTSFTLEEFDRFAFNYLEARGYDMKGPGETDDAKGGNGGAIDDALDVLGRHLQDDDNSGHDTLDLLRQVFHASLVRVAS